ncbi:MAG: FAD-binding oxidoreductase, partial [Gammaproteobacteria bacterium]|nr:FAD-binding oxidoreductase [Gammaproteobacteria bacterium]
MQVNTFPITLEESFMISPKVKHFIFKCDNTPEFNYLPGQFITIHFDRDGKNFKRSYSIANNPEQNNR